MSSSWALIPKQQWGAPSVLQYRETRQVGKGTYGDVFLGEHITTKDIVALKKVSIKHNDAKHHHRGLPLNALREIRLLKSSKCEHPNIVKLLEVAADDNNNNQEDNKPLPFCYLVFEYVEHDLAGIIDSSQVPIPVPLIKCLVKQLLAALEHLHAENICHRDLKCSNLLITSRNVLKLGDFGLARELKDDGRKLSLNVITLWYRPPEILLGDVRYTTSVDMWGVGCILVELFNRKPLFPGKKDETDQLKLIYGMCGQPNERDCPRLVELPGFKPSSKSNGSTGDLNEYFVRKQLDADAITLALRLLEMEPTRRCTAKQALQSQFVNINCFAPHDLPPIDAKTSLHEWETKMKNKAAAAAATAAPGTTVVEKPEQQQQPAAPLPPQDALLRRASSTSRRRQHQRRSRSPRRRY